MKKHLFFLFFIISIKGSLFSQKYELDKSIGIEQLGIIKLDTGKIYYDYLIQKDGKILVAGQYQGAGFIERYTSNGFKDNEFGVNGIFKLAVNSSIFNIIQLDDNSILCNGSTLKNFILKITSNGMIDKSFGINGFSQLPDIAITNINNIRIDQNNNIYVAGDYIYDPWGFSFDFSFVFKLLPNGLLNQNFGDRTNYISSISQNISGQHSIIDFVIQKNNNLIILQKCKFELSTYYKLFIFDFTNGISNEINLDYFTSINEIISTDNNDIFIYGITGINNNINRIVKLNSIGNLDNNFNNIGILEIESDIIFNNIKVLNNEKIISVGYKKNSSSNYILSISRYNPDGTLDSTFNENGYLEYKNTDKIFSSIDITIINDEKINILGKITERYIHTKPLDNNIYQFVNKEISDVNMENINLYPNPTDNILLCEYNIDNPTKININIYDINGNLIQTPTENENRESGFNKEIINIRPQLPTGTYILELTAGNKKISKKFIKY